MDNIDSWKVLIISIGGLLGGLAIVTASLSKIVGNLNNIISNFNIKLFKRKIRDIYVYTRKVNGAKVEGSFEKDSDGEWSEFDDKKDVINRFSEINRDENYITIFDNPRGIKLKIPIIGGWILITGFEEGWVSSGGQDCVNQTGPLYYVTRIK